MRTWVKELAPLWRPYIKAALCTRKKKKKSRLFQETQEVVVCCVVLSRAKLSITTRQACFPRTLHQVRLCFKSENLFELQHFQEGKWNKSTFSASYLCSLHSLLAHMLSLSLLSQITCVTWVQPLTDVSVHECDFLYEAPLAEEDLAIPVTHSHRSHREQDLTPADERCCHGNSSLTDRFAPPVVQESEQKEAQVQYFRFVAAVQRCAASLTAGRAESLFFNQSSLFHWCREDPNLLLTRNKKKNKKECRIKSLHEHLSIKVCCPSCCLLLWYSNRLCNVLHTTVNQPNIIHPDNNQSIMTVLLRPWLSNKNSPHTSRAGGHILFLLREGSGFTQHQKIHTYFHET